MSRYNLLDEQWIPVIIDDKGTSQMVSLTDIFTKSSQYLKLVGDTQTQSFAVFRVLLAILQTALLRYELDGEERELPDEDWGYEDIEDLEEELTDEWLEVWQAGVFPEIVINYLEDWRDRFYLFDDKYPFYQVTKEDIESTKLKNNSEAGYVYGKYINRLLSESNNKISLFSPKYAAGKNKDLLSKEELARWLITFQGYTGTAEKSVFFPDNYTKSHGWLLDIGAIYVEGNNLFETLMLNCILLHPLEEYRFKPPRPCWEFETEERIQRYLETKSPNNLEELYTNWSRAIYIDPETDCNQPFQCQAVKLPEIRNEDQFLEPMTLWKYNDSGSNKDKFTPKKHQANQAIWRSFGLIALPTNYSDKQRQPGIISWLNHITPLIGERKLTLCSVCMIDRGSYHTLEDEFYDQMRIDDFVLTDIKENHWVSRIYDTVETTKRVVDLTFRKFLLNLKEIRNLSSNDFVNERVAELYFHIDEPFRNWLVSIDKDDDKDQKVIEWFDQLASLVRGQVDQLLKQAGPRDYTGIIKDEKLLNIATAHNSFSYYLNKELKEGRHESK